MTGKRLRSVVIITIAILAISGILACGEPTPTVPDVPPEVTQFASDWPLPNKDYKNTRATMTSEIDSSNVDQLAMAWSMPLRAAAAVGAAATTPIIIGDTVLFQDLQNNTFALDIADGSIKWQRMFGFPNVGPNGVAVGWGKAFVTSDPFSITALDLETGQTIWTSEIADDAIEGIDIQPQVYGGKVLVSTVPGSTFTNFYTGGAVGVIFALDQETGEVAWSFSTVDSEDIWGNPDVNNGGGVWYPPAVDTDTGQTFWSIANPAPWPGTAEFPNGSSRPGPNLYTNTLVSLDISDGNLNWYTQALPHDIKDYDLQLSPILTEANVNGQQQEIVITGGKMGRVYAMNRETGATLWTTPVGEHQNDELASFPDEAVRVLPGALGGVETPMAYAEGVVYVPVVNIGAEATGSTYQLDPPFAGTGNLVAIEVATGDILWSVDLDRPSFGGATVVNDLVFTGTYDSTIRAFDRETGAEVFTFGAPSNIIGWPAITGDTIIWPVGQGGIPSLIALRLGAEGPILNIRQPAPDVTLDGTSSVTVSTDVFNFDIVDKLGEAAVPGEGHLHFYLDVEVPTTQGEPAVTEEGTFMVTTNTSVTWENVEPGEHTFAVQLVNNDHTPLASPVVREVTVLVSEAGVTITQPGTGAILGPGDVTISVQASNFDIVDKLGESAVPGEGHLHFYLDVEVPTTQGEPAVTEQGTYIATTDTSVTWENLTEGLHVLSVQLVNNDHTPLEIPVVETVKIIVSPPGGGGGP
jgi:outer membrane protein assembly factor BamB